MHHRQNDWSCAWQNDRVILKLSISIITSKMMKIENLVSHLPSRMFVSVKLQWSGQWRNPFRIWIHTLFWKFSIISRWMVSFYCWFQCFVERQYLNTYSLLCFSTPQIFAIWHNRTSISLIWLVRFSNNDTQTDYECRQTEEVILNCWYVY